MKCLIKNRKTGEEIICEKVEVGEFSYYYSNEYPSIEEYGLSGLNDIVKLGYHYDNKLYKKVIATNNKSLDLPQVVDEVEELAEVYSRSQNGVGYEDEHPNCNYTLGECSIDDYKAGYNKAKETYEYTKETIGSYKAKIITPPEPFPEKWYLICDEENQEVVNGWRNEKADLCYKDKTVDIGWYFLSRCPYDDSYYSCGNVPNDYRFKGYCPITFEQFKEHVLKQPKQSNKMKITSEQAQKIIDTVSPSCKWKERLLDLWAKSIVLKQEIEVDDSLYKEGYKDASEGQKKVLDGIFGKSKEVDITERPVNYFLIPRTDGDYKDKSFYLTNNYNWEIKKDNFNNLCLIPTNK